MIFLYEEKAVQKEADKLLMRCEYLRETVIPVQNVDNRSLLMNILMHIETSRHKGASAMIPHFHSPYY